MGWFSSRGRKPAEGARAALPRRLREQIPPRFEVIAEALAAGEGSVDACAVVGGQLAREGTSLVETLDALRLTARLVTGTDPSYDTMLALSMAWSETTLGYLHQLSCEDPMTGLASLAHVRTRLSELYRGQTRESEPVQDGYALVVVHVPVAGPAVEPGESERISLALRLTRMAEAARTVFGGSDTIGRLGRHRVVVVARRDERLGQRVSLLRRMVGGLTSAGQPPRVWIEGLPSTDASAAALLDELART